MLDNDNIISTSVSEADEKVLTDENDYRNTLSRASLFTAAAYKQRTDIYIQLSKNSYLPTFSVAKKFHRRHFA